MRGGLLRFYTAKTLFGHAAFVPRCRRAGRSKDWCSNIIVTSCHPRRPAQWPPCWVTIRGNASKVTSRVGG